MAYTASKLIEIAAAEIGYHEKASNANLDSKTANSGNKNFTKYGRDLHKAGYYNGNKNGYDWCDQFVDWCFFKLCGNKDRAEYIECQTGNYGAGCGYSLKYYKAAGRFDRNPKVGDQIFFKYTDDSSTADHTGIVVRVTDSLVETVEGNSGGEVKRKAYQRGKTKKARGFAQGNHLLSLQKSFLNLSHDYTAVKPARGGKGTDKSGDFLAGCPPNIPVTFCVDNAYSPISLSTWHNPYLCKEGCPIN